MPEASASTQAFASPSRAEASAIASAAPIQRATSPCGTLPSSRTRSPTPNRSASAASALRSSPCPRIASVAPGTRAIAAMTTS